MPTDKYLKYWPIAVFVVTTGVAFAGNWAVFGVRMNAIEARQDRQGNTIMSLQDADKSQQSNYAELKAKVDIMIDDIRYIRARIDRVTQ